MTDSAPDDIPIHVETDQARGGETTGHMRYVLAISVVLAIGVLSAIVWFPLLFHK